MAWTKEIQMSTRSIRRVAALALVAGSLGLAAVQAAPGTLSRNGRPSRPALEAPEVHASLREAWGLLRSLWLGDSAPPGQHPPGQHPPGRSGADPKEGSGIDPHGGKHHP
jgi:hypothetical protein